MKRAILFPFLLLLVSCLKEDETLKKPFDSFEPIGMNDGWSISTPADEQMNSEILSDIYRDFHEDPDTWQVRSLLVFRNGKLVAESYTKDNSDIYTPRAIWSATKQILGLLTGIALKEQIIHSVEDPISEYLTETDLFPDKKDIRIQDLLTMKSGIGYSNDGLQGQTDDILRQLPARITDFILGIPLANEPGTLPIYKDCDPQLVSSVIQAAIGRPTFEWAKEVLFNKLEINNLEWNSYRDGVTLGGFGILTTPREMAKFGQVVLDSGQWKGSQLVDKEWIRQMTSEMVPDIYGYRFGYLWWKDPEREMNFMSGHGGQFVCIIPPKRLMVVMTAEVNTQGAFQFGGDKAFKWVDRVVEAAQ